MSCELRLSDPPARPILIWDGDCRFCALWVERWRVLTGARIDDSPFQQAADQFPEVPRELFERAIVYIDEQGRVFSAAEAIFRSLQFGGHRLVAWAYDHVPAFAAASEFFYGIVANHRRFSSAVTRIFWGQNVRPPTYQHTALWFLRGLGLTYLVAFVSCWVQVDGLIGSDGILPISDFLKFAQQQLGAQAVTQLPTLCWINSSNSSLYILCGSGVFGSIALIVGAAPVLCLAALFICYLSLAVAGQTFFHFQWDILLLETGFLALFFAPLRWWLTSRTEYRVSRVGLFLLKLLLFKLMFMSGVVKLTSGDDSWKNLTALDYHYWSQPLPTVFAWFADKQPEWFKHFSVAACLLVEIAVPFFLWAPRRLRIIAAALLIGLQITIAITGNYCFFNLLTLVLCLLLLDDSALAFRRRRNMEGRAPASPQAKASQELRPPSSRLWQHIQSGAAVVVAAVTLPLNAWHIYSGLKPEAEMPSLLSPLAERIDPFRICSGYGLFRVMTKDRREIVVEGSNDGLEWATYEFKWKPGDINRVPGWCAPHQPRLDWQMWFAALSTAGHNRWFLQFVGCLLQNKQSVTGLLAHNPFPNGAPRYIRARFYRYRFSSAEERRQTDAWWTREELGEYLPTVSLK